MTAILNVDEFEYAPVMWSNDKIELDASIMDRVATTGYDINIQIGVLDEKTGTIYGHKTSLISDYPVMIHYPDNSVKVRAARFDKDDINTNALVMLVTTHEGYLYYQYL